MNIDKIIDIKCCGEVFVDIDELNFFQNKLKTIHEDTFKDLKSSLIKSGLPLSFHIWIDDKTELVMGSNIKNERVGFLKEGRL